MGIGYRRVDISTDPEAREYVMALGYLFSSGFATVSMADQRIVGAPDAWRCAGAAFDRRPHSSR
jgi:hypothetical protein